jgi:segregation and condensation protein A
MGDEVANEVLSKKTNQLASEESNAGLSMSRQEEMPFAVVQGKELTALPKDLYIPPDALEIILEAFEGPLDLLLYLIRRQNLDILEIDVAEITKQYMGYIDLMSTIQLELASEYLVMAAMLAEIKSRILLPRQVAEDDDEGDPRAELIRRLQDYERFKMAAEDIDEMPRMGRDIYQASAESPDKKNEKQYSEVQMQELLMALSDVMKRAEMFESHHIQLEKLSTRERMSQILENIRDKQFVPFATLFKKSEGRLGVVVTFLAIMELIRESLVEIVQNESFGPIHIKAKSS